MEFTEKKNGKFVFTGILAIAALALIAWVTSVGPAPSVIAAGPGLSAVPGTFQSNGPASIVSAVDVTPATRLASASPQYYYQPVTAWYKNKHWWKKNAPIVGGAGGGALIGGLAGGGKGALIGGAIGGGGGYAYKRIKRHEQRRHYQNNYHNVPQNQYHH